jgi:adenosine deaminase
MKKHPLPKMIIAGLKVTINSDDPAYFGGYLNENFEAISGLVNDSPLTLAQLAKNSFNAAFIDDKHKTDLCAEVDAYLANW